MFGECYVIGYVIHGEYYAQVVVDGQGGETGSQLDGFQRKIDFTPDKGRYSVALGSCW